MSTFHILTLIFLIALLNTTPLSFSADSPEFSPSPAPEVGADAAAPPPSNSSSPSPEPTPSASPSPSLNSPPAPPPDLAPESSPAPGTNSTDTNKEKSPAPAPAVESDIGREDAGDLESEDDSSGGMSGRKKAGIAIGVVASVCIVGIGALVYKKRQQNIRRAQFGYAARREFL